MRELKDYLSNELQDCRQNFPAAWRKSIWGRCEKLLDFDAIPCRVSIDKETELWPSAVSSEYQGVVPLFKAFNDLDPRCVRVVVFGNDPYPCRHQATGRSFEQGDLVCWDTNLNNLRDKRASLSDSLLSIMSAAVATHPAAHGHELDKRNLKKRRQKLQCVIRSAGNQLQLPTPNRIFEYWAQQGVLWVNRSLTFTSKKHQDHHRNLWIPFTQKVIQQLVLEAKCRRIVFALWGNKAQELCVQIGNACEKYSVPISNIQIAKTGHPSFPAHFFRCGNPLEEINRLLGSPRICWVPSARNFCV